MHLAHEELQADDGVDNDDEEDQQGDVEQRNHGFDYGVQHYLQTCRTDTEIQLGGPKHGKTHNKNHVY